MPYRPFQSVEPAPPDPILGLSESFKDDPNPDKINLSVGVYLDEHGVNPVLKSVKQAEKILLEEETTKTYLPIAGEGAVGVFARELVFGAGHPVITGGQCATLQTPGGTGGLRLGADFIRSQFPGATVWISDPTWPNHTSIFTGAGLPVKTYPYLDMEQQALRFEEILATLEAIPEGDVVVLHACCHNPSGIDPTPEQWEQLLELFARRPITPFFDFAYQGLGEGIEQDARAPRLFGAAGLEMLVSTSFSKSFGLYRERVGSLTLVGGNAQEVQKAFSRLKLCARANYSNPPAHGGLVVKTVVTTPQLKKLWLEELEQMRHRIQEMRVLFVETLRQCGVSRDFGFLSAQKGMFSFSGIGLAEVRRLRGEFGIYLLDNGRMNVAAMTHQNMGYLCRSIAQVLEN